jgi:hypothetical protein
MIVGHVPETFPPELQSPTMHRTLSLHGWLAPTQVIWVHTLTLVENGQVRPNAQSPSLVQGAPAAPTGWHVAGVAFALPQISGDAQPGPSSHEAPTPPGGAHCWLERSQ